MFRGLCDLIRRGTIDPTNFSWKEVLPQLGDTNDDYARTFKAVLARQETKTPFANNLMSFPALLSCITNNTVTIDTLTQSISTYLQENPPPTR